MRILALDPGERRIGVAISDPTETLARPLETVRRKSRVEDFAAIARLVETHGAGLVVIGRPLSLDGTEGPQARRVARYAQALADHLPVDVVSWDERFTTIEAKEIVEKQGRELRDKGELDAIAAAVILQSYLDSQRSGQ